MGSLRVMVVDDSVVTTSKITTVLEDLGHSVAGVARSGTEAVRDYASIAPDLVTMDITMPEMNGIEATRRILADHPDALIVMVTSHGHQHMIIEALKAGAKGYMLKPIRRDKLQDMIDQVVSNYRKK